MIFDSTAPFFAEIGVSTFLVILLAGLVTSAIHGASGVAGGFLMAAAIAPLIGVRPVLPVLSVALLVSHSARALLNIGDFDRKAFAAIIVSSIPAIVLAAIAYSRLSTTVIAVVFAVVIVLSIPLRRIAMSRNIKATEKTLTGAGAVYGLISGLAVGPGMLLVPFLLGYGLSRQAFVATLAVIALTTNITRVAVFGGTQLLDWNYLALGLAVGLVTIPGNWLGRWLLRRMTNEGHAGIVDILTVIGAMNFVWLAWRG
ncbi:MAG TPA: sulfite exporter TauE/SafE family protein [Afifellaceae bacterium]|nr:sulfite exporter TauE/SafE family protein [Afifellaceae bacterium]